MLNILKCVFVLIFLCNSAHGLMSGLSVQMLDKDLIARKRQDTREMCWLFAAENDKTLFNKNKLRTDKYKPYNNNIRSKRDANVIKLGSPAVSKESAKVIEERVDKLYETLQNGGEKIKDITKEIDDLPATSTATESIAWPKKWKRGILPYFIDSRTYDTQLAEVITRAFDYFEKTTCIRLQRLRDRPTDLKSLKEVQWLYISNPTGIRQCVHSNEKKNNKGVQMVIFGYNCLSLGEIVHEIMHVLGFSHEHTRPDRDEHITIVWDNIKPSYKKYFQVQSENHLLNIPYDYSSVLHYPSRAFSKNGQVTILSRENNQKFGQRDGLSVTDIEKVGLIYGDECIERNKQYLLKTCPSVIRPNQETYNISKSEITKYFRNRIWPYGVINYKIKDNFEFTIDERENIKAVIRHIEEETCVIFRDLSNEGGNRGTRDTYTLKHIADNEITKDDKKGTGTKSMMSGNYTGENDQQNSQQTRRHVGSTIVLSKSLKSGCPCPTSGKPDGDKIIQINSDCFNSVNDLLHLFVHLLGLDHQHNMHDRDSYLHILWENLTPDLEADMMKKLPPAASVGFDYDYQSVMHYPWLQIKNGVSNIMYPIWNDGWAMGHWRGLSSRDVQKINYIYSDECLQRLKSGYKVAS
ncbi:hypothetical protein ACJJTC_018101 [Scirpophaga incertulas]